MSKYVKILLQAIALLCITLGVFSAQAMAKTNIQYEVINGDTLVISGNGETEEAIEYGKEVKESKIKKLIIKEGITTTQKLRLGLFSNLKEINLPNSLVEIADCSFMSNRKLQKIIFGKKTKIIGTNAFSGCTSLTNIELPETVEQIQDGAFSECSRLKRIVLPKNLKEIDIYALEHCPALEIIINDSKIPCYMPWYKKYVTWRVDGKKTKTIPAGKTGTSTRKKLSIQYDLRGGQETKKLPRTYRFGDSVTLPETVKRKGYVFMGWSDKMYADVEKVESGQKKAKFYATWYKYKVESKKTGTATVSFDSSQAKVLLEAHAIRYSVYKDMSLCDEKYCNKSKGRVRIKHLEPGKTYYFEICGVRNPDHPFEKWRAKRKVSICG
ncbi:MAG: leucine-rich repeat protein [Eubacterium sp.]